MHLLLPGLHVWTPAIGKSSSNCFDSRESGFESVEALMKIAKHGRGQNIYLVRFHYLPAGAWR